MANVKISPLNVRRVNGVLYMHQLIQTPIGVAQVQVAVNETKVQNVVRNVLRRLPQAQGKVGPAKVQKAAAAASLKGGLELAAVCGGLPLKALRATAKKAAHQARDVEVEVDDDDEDDEDDGDEDDDAAGFLRKLFRRKRRGGPQAPADEAPEGEEEAPAAAAGDEAGDHAQASPDDTNPPTHGPVDEHPHYVDVGPSTPSQN